MKFIFGDTQIMNMKSPIFLYLILSVFLTQAFAQDLGIILLKVYNKKMFENQSIQGYLASEKLDGVRGIWNGKELRSKQGKLIDVPKCWLEGFPAFGLDGELWIGRRNFEETSKIVRSRGLSCDKWNKVTYNVFDVPNCGNDTKHKAFGSFEIKKLEKNKQSCTLQERLFILEDFLQHYPNPHIRVIQQIPLSSDKQLQDLFSTIVQKGGEGVVLRKNSYPYEEFRTTNALKLKPYEDAECLIIGYTKGKGHFSNKVGAIICEQESSTFSTQPKETKNTKIIFKIGIGMSDEFRANPPPIGTIITYKYTGLTKNNLPKFPVFLRIFEE